MKADEDGKGRPIPWLTPLRLTSGGFTLIGAVIAATFTLTTLATNSQMNALHLQNAMLDRRVQELQEQLRLRQDGQTVSQDEPGPPSTQEGTHVPERVSGRNKISVAFESPTAGSTVPQYVDVKYAVSGTIPAGCRTVLLVRDPLGQYWSWGSTARGYHPRVQVGVATDEGRQFELGVLVTRRDIKFGVPLTSLPRGEAYKAITVTRE